MGDDARGLTRGDFAVVSRVSTRWSDNDMFGHLNNAVCYELFDSALNEWFIAGTGIDESQAPVIGVVAESSCRFYRELAYPTPVDVGLRVERVGTRSLVLELGIFAADEEPIAAHGRWVQVYIDVETRASVPLPAAVRALAHSAVVAPGAAPA